MAAGGCIVTIDKITYLTDVAMITCVVSVGRSDAVIQAAQRMGAGGSIVYHARGIGARERLGLLGIAVEAEKEVISFMVAIEHQDTVFEAAYRAAELDVPGAGFIYVTRIDKLATYVPRQLLQRIESKDEPA